MWKRLLFLLSFHYQRYCNHCFCRLSIDKKQSFRKEKLKKMVSYAKSNSSYYRELYRDIEADASIEEFPIILKQDIVTNFDDLITSKDVSKEKLKEYFTETFDFEKRYRNKYLAFHTSGSTGNPVYVIWGEDVFGISLSNYYFRIKSVVGLEATKKIKVAYIGITDDYVGGNSWVYGMKEFADIRILSVFSPMEELVAKLNSFRPELIFTKPSLLGELAKMKRDGKLKIAPKDVIFAGEMITPQDSRNIEKYFGIKPINSYSTCETGPVAVQMNSGQEGLRIFDDLIWLELVDEDNRPIHEYYKVGYVVITNLYNKYMPVIRYKIGDRAYFVPDGDQHCGNTISYIQGRGTSYFLFENGRKECIHVAEFPFWSLYIPGISRYQVVQKSQKELLIRIEFEIKGDVSAKKEIEEAFLKKLHRILKPYDLVEYIHIEVEEAERILPNKAGKIQVTMPLK